MDLRYTRLQICTEIPTKKTQTTKWRVCLHPQGIEYDREDYMGLRLQLVNCGGEFKKTIVKFKATIIDNEHHRDRIFKEEVKELNADMNEICWEEFCDGDKDLIRFELLEDGALTIYIRISYCIECTFYGPDVVKCDLLDDFGSLLEDSKHADVELTLQSNGKKYFVHRAILAARSGHFARLFEDVDKKHEQITVMVTNTDEEIIDEILRYIYKGECEISNQTADRLLSAANQYELEGLKTLCSQFMCDEFSCGSAAKVIV
ncbi:protein roadkill-like [Planococcus citri]|uniref:protein roadkill-like n=1 Tax=Planococcus citri TaxID=170843 RepID=UPI0031F9A40F